MTDQDYQTVRAMEKHGGSFISTLGKAARYADEANLAKLKEAFPLEWARYRDLAGKQVNTNDSR